MEINLFTNNTTEILWKNLNAKRHRKSQENSILYKTALIESVKAQKSMLAYWWNLWKGIIKAENEYLQMEVQIPFW